MAPMHDFGCDMLPAWAGEGFGKAFADAPENSEQDGEDGKGADRNVDGLERGAFWAAWHFVKHQTEAQEGEDCGTNDPVVET